METIQDLKTAVSSLASAAWDLQGSDVPSECEMGNKSFEMVRQINNMIGEIESGPQAKLTGRA